MAAGETLWECTKKRKEHACDVTVKSLNGVIVSPVFPGDHDHLHAPDPDEIEVLRARSAMKRRAQDTTEPTQTINRNIVPLPQQVLARIGTTESIKRDIRRQRTNNMPAVPDDNDRPRFTITANGDHFIQYDNNLRRHMIIFGTAESHNNLSTASHCTVPVQSAQLYTVHGLSLGRNNVDCYGLLPDKRTETYKIMLTQVQSLTGSVVPQRCMIDFEIGAINAFDTIYPNVPKFGCHFHLAQSIFRNVQQLGLGNLYQNDLGFRTNIKMISALAFVHVANVIRDFNSLAAQYGLAKQPVLDYFENTYWTTTAGLKK